MSPPLPAAFRALFGDARGREVLDLAARFPERAAHVDEIAFVRQGSFAPSVARSMSVGRPSSVAPPISALSVVAWNIQRGADPDRWAEHPAFRSADLLLLCEVDDGMARSQNLDVARELAQRLGLHYAYVPNYFEFTRGTRRERRATRGHENARGFHGNAILSRFALPNVRRVPMPVEYDWFRHEERRIGTRVALVAEVAVPGCPLWAVSAHLEAFASPRGRATQLRALLSTLSGASPVVMGGDFNTLGVKPDWRGALSLLVRRATSRDRDPSMHEPLFAEAERAGFSACEFERGDVTWRPNRKWPRALGARLDWVFARDAKFEGRAATCEPPRRGSSAFSPLLSDHDGVVVRLALPTGDVTLSGLSGPIR